MSEFEADAPSPLEDHNALRRRRHEGMYARLTGYPLRREPRDVAPRDVMIAVREALAERYGPPHKGQVLPAGLRLEMHPGVRLWFLADDDELLEGARDIPEDLFEVPVRFSTDLPEGRWRLVIVTEEVLLGGGIYREAPGGQ